MSKVGKVICLVALFWMIAPVAQAQQKPFTLEQCVQIALENNAQVLIAKRRVGIAQTNVASARSTILPRLSSSVSLGQFRSGPRTLQMDVPVGFDPETGRAIFEQREIVQEGFRRDNYSMRFSLNQTLFDFGQSINNIKKCRCRAGCYAVQF
ncbi:MAG: TolC family protein [candidate division KSB1 bacterium]|nr:TolC family protein [candidate division KSB1 bacterium]